MGIISDADEIYLDAISKMETVDRDRLRNVLINLLNQPDMAWDQAIREAVEASKHWVPEHERRAALARLDAGEEEYNEAIKAQDAMET